MTNKQAANRIDAQTREGDHKGATATFFAYVTGGAVPNEISQASRQGLLHKAGWALRGDRVIPV